MVHVDLAVVGSQVGRLLVLDNHALEHLGDHLTEHGSCRVHDHNVLGGRKPQRNRQRLGQILVLDHICGRDEENEGLQDFELFGAQVCQIAEGFDKDRSAAHV